ncbi:MAG TPA: ABC transporter permease [Candidatus Eisenbacteria bacterium]|jgi:ABC-type transport system involved in multi-copper enzyme maturation permease subunit|nr:ABC transporter permease [Candidatus Eisenbacteria bacterium]
MIASFRAEWLKFRTRPANWVLVLILVATLLAFSYILTYLISTHPPQGFRTEGGLPPSVLKRMAFPENLLSTVLADTSGLGVAIVLIMGALSAGNEYSWLTWQTILVQRPARLAVFLGKLLLLILVTLVLALAMFGAAALTSLVLVQIDGSTSSFASWANILKAIGAAWLVLATWTAFGLVLAVLFRGVAGSIGAGLVYVFVVEGLIAGLLRGVPGLKEVLRVLPGVNGGGIVAAFRGSVPQRGVPAPLVSAGRGALTVAIYLLVFSVVAALIVRRRDLA